MKLKISRTASKAVFLITALLAGAFSAAALNPKPKVSYPDFAYPRTVAREARDLLSHALSANCPEDALRALLNLTVSENMVSTEQVVPVINTMDSVARLLPQPYSAVIFLMEAQLYQDIYNSNSYQYSNRVVSEDFEDLNPQFWDASLFSRKINSLISKSLDEKTAAESLSLSAIRSVITDVKEIEEYTIYDFIVYKSLALWGRIPTEDDVIPFFVNKDKATPKGDVLIDQLLALHPSPSTPRNTAILFKTTTLGDGAADYLWKQILDQTDSKYCIPLLVKFYSSYLWTSESSAPASPTPIPEDDENSNKFSSRRFIEFWQLLNDVRARFKGEEFSSELDKIHESLIAPEISLSSPSLIETNKSFKVEIENKNSNSFYLLLLKAGESKERSATAAMVRKMPVVGVKEFSFSNMLPFSLNDSTTFEVTEPGSYVLVASSRKTPDGLISTSPSERFDFIVASDIDLLNVNPNYIYSAEAEGSYVVSSANGQPIEKAKVTFKPYGNRNSLDIKSVETNSEGFAPTDMRNGDVNASYKGSVATGSLYKSESTLGENSKINLFASQAVYRPGDTVEFFGLATESTSSSGKILPNRKIRVSLSNANYEEVDSLSLVSDDSGRIFGSFQIPQNGLLGYWSIGAKFENQENKGYVPLNVLGFQVADYKVPAFMVTIEKKEATTDSIRFAGTAITFSGMPVSYAQVSYEVKYSPYYTYRWRGMPDQTYTATTQTDGEGNFEISLPLGNIDPKVYNGVFLISATVTDEAGETNSSSDLSFWLKQSYSLVPSVPSYIKLDGNEMKLEVKVTDAIGLPVVIPVEYMVVNSEGVDILSGEFESPVFSFPVDNLPSGEYRFSFRLKEEDSQWADYSSILYRTSDPIPPVESVLWCPETTVIAEAGSKETSIGYGSSFKDQYILCIISDSRGNSSSRWLRSDGTNTEVKIPSPSDNTRAYITLITVKDHKTFSREITVVPAEQTKKFEIVTETFRKQLSAGDREEWRFRLLNGKEPVEGYAYAILYDKAMNSILDFQWPSTVFTPRYPSMLHLSSQQSYPRNVIFRTGKGIYINGPERPSFSFQTYGYPLYSHYVYYKTRKSAATSLQSHRGNGNAMIAGTTSGANFPGDDEVYYYDDTAPAMAKMQADYGVVDFASNEVSAEGSSEEEGLSAFNDEPVRQIEMPVAFFKPDLKSNDKGEIAIDFTVPNFNTTWNFVLGSYTSDLKSTSINLETVASKSVMVKMVAPRFLRTGDCVDLTATIYNNSTDELDIYGIYEVFNPATGEILMRTVGAENTIRPSGNFVFTTDFTCPSELSAIGLRVYGKSSLASDGEETIIPVLPSSQPVIASQPFYLKPGQTSFTLEMPAFPKDGTVTFTYCDNPLWEVVTALPPIINSDSKAAGSLVEALYANCVGLGLMENNPSLKEGLSLIVGGEAGDSLLISNLRKNPELKVVTLSNTPWVNNADNETLRLSKLGTLLDEESALADIGSLWNKIMNLRNSDGGWSWCNGMNSSRWITESILLNLGMLEKSHYLPELPNLNLAVSSAVSFCDKSIVEDYYKYGNKNEDSFVRSLWSYLYARSFFSDVAMVTGFSSLHRKALNTFEKDWKHSGIYEKATLALVLWRNGRQKSALEILESLREFATINDQRAHFDNLQEGYGSMGKLATTARVLQAFNEIKPSDPIIDGLRQWMIIQKQAQQWQEGSLSVYAIDALLSSGSDWSGEYSAPIITIGWKTIEMSRVERLTGSCKVNVDIRNGSNSDIRIQRESPTQAWGGVVCQYIAPMDEVKADEIEELSIRKDYLSIMDDSGSVKAISGKNLKIGDKVRVTMTIDCGRDMDYVVINDERSACLEPVNQLSGYTSIDGLWCYRETRNNVTNIYIPFLPKGRHVISYDCYASEAGEFAGGVATIQSLYSPLLTAHSAGAVLKVSEIVGGVYMAF